MPGHGAEADDAAAASAALDSILRSFVPGDDPHSQQRRGEIARTLRDLFASDRFDLPLHAQFDAEALAHVIRRSYPTTPPLQHLLMDAGFCREAERWFASRRGRDMAAINLPWLQTRQELVRAINHFSQVGEVEFHLHDGMLRNGGLALGDLEERQRPLLLVANSKVSMRTLIVPPPGVTVVGKDGTRWDLLQVMRPPLPGQRDWPIEAVLSQTQHRQLKHRMILAQLSGTGVPDDSSVAASPGRRSEAKRQRVVQTNPRGVPSAVWQLVTEFVPDETLRRMQQTCRAWRTGSGRFHSRAASCEELEWLVRARPKLQRLTLDWEWGTALGNRSELLERLVELLEFCDKRLLADHAHFLKFLPKLTHLDAGMLDLCREHLPEVSKLKAVRVNSWMHPLAELIQCCPDLESIDMQLCGDGGICDEDIRQAAAHSRLRKFWCDADRDCAGESLPHLRQVTDLVMRGSGIRPKQFAGLTQLEHLGLVLPHDPDEEDRRLLEHMPGLRSLRILKASRPDLLDLAPLRADARLILCGTALSAYLDAPGAVPPHVTSLTLDHSVRWGYLSPKWKLPGHIVTLHVIMDTFSKYPGMDGTDKLTSLTITAHRQPDIAAKFLLEEVGPKCTSLSVLDVRDVVQAMSKDDIEEFHVALRAFRELRPEVRVVQ